MEIEHLNSRCPLPCYMRDIKLKWNKSFFVGEVQASPRVGAQAGAPVQAHALLAAVGGVAAQRGARVRAVQLAQLRLALRQVGRRLHQRVALREVTDVQSFERIMG